MTSITVRRRVAWNETDAAGHNHFSAAFRWLEEAEHEMMRSLGVSSDLIDRIPRVHIDIDYLDRLYFGEEIIVTVSVTKVGRSSCSLSMLVTHGEGKEAIKANYVIVNASSTTAGSAQWSDETRNLLESGKQFEVTPDISLIG